MKPNDAVLMITPILLSKIRFNNYSVSGLSAFQCNKSLLRFVRTFGRTFLLSNHIALLIFSMSRSSTRCIDVSSRLASDTRIFLGLSLVSSAALLLQACLNVWVCILFTSLSCEWIVNPCRMSSESDPVVIVAVQSFFAEHCHILVDFVVVFKRYKKSSTINAGSRFVWDWVISMALAKKFNQLSLQLHATNWFRLHTIGWQTTHVNFQISI